jgi:hypothetical protein
MSLTLLTMIEPGAWEFVTCVSMPATMVQGASGRIASAITSE